MHMIFVCMIYLVCADAVSSQDMVMAHQERRAAVTDDVVRQFMEVRPLDF